MRRNHRKTRTGCSQCKQRRVKCDEQKPSCQNCLRNFLPCSLEFLVPSKPRITTGKISSPRTAPNTISHPTLDISLRASSLDPKSAELLHHYISIASLDFGETRNMHVWQIVVPQMALAHNFLMHGIVAISALHLSRLQSQFSRRRKAELVQIALRSENLALPAFRRSLLERNERNIHAVFAFSGLVVPYMLAVSTLREGFRGYNDAIPRLEHTHWFHSLRGVTALLEGSWGTLNAGPLAPWLMRSLPMEDWGVNPDDVYFLKAYEILQYESVVGDVDEELGLCRMALDELRRTASLPFSPCRTVNRVSAALIWPGSIPQGFMLLLDGRKPEALIVLAHYCVQLKKVNSCWNFEGVGENMLRAIDEQLEEKWKPWIQWALEHPLE